MSSLSKTGWCYHVLPRYASHLDEKRYQFFTTHQESKLTQEKHWRCEQTNLRKSTIWHTHTHVSIIREKKRHHDHWTEILLRENLQPTTPAARGLLSSMKRLCWAGLSIGPMRHLNEALLVEVSVAILMQQFLDTDPKSDDELVTLESLAKMI